jgi:hypothetical protein
VEKLDHRCALRRQEVDIIYDQPTCTSISSAEIVQVACSHRLKEAVCECLSGKLDDLQGRVYLPQHMADAFEQVTFAQSDGAVDYQWVKRGTS